LRLFRILLKSTSSLRLLLLSFCLSSCISAPYAGQINVKFGGLRWKFVMKLQMC
jgi:hypothetical protein